MKSGYAFELTEGAVSWVGLPDDDWETVVYNPTGQEVRVGARNIDGSRCVVFRRPEDGRFVAQTAAFLGSR